MAGAELSFIRVTVEDIVLANRLAAEVQARFLDELPPQTQNLGSGLTTCGEK